MPPEPPAKVRSPSSDSSSGRSASRRRFLQKSALAGGSLVLGAAGLNEAGPLLWPESQVFETNHSYWSQAASPANPALTKDIDVDVAVLGGGLTGLSSAYYLCRNRPGTKAAVLEA